ncbi:MazG family protein [Nocardioides mangrovi]|uniref:MazG family protein n=1 Tax=Nocardioides mangrovi TaxID=2874580 RepID=A0ABS7UFI2_9ACTN|nr:MazG family protein [Nocardioides mangrovi]MBZ5739750.1 MazG family protein [Nocardioides mangrovi]
MTTPASGEPLLEFLEVMRRLRAECSWKAGQTHRSLARYLLEETHETLEAIDTGDGELLREELGDLLLQVYFHAVIAEEAGEFTLDDVAADITAKMHRRNPHVFAPEGGQRAEAGTPAEINEVWESIKAQEKRRTSVTEGLPDTLPALLYADKVVDRLERAGADVEPDDSLGGRLLALVREARAEGVDPEQTLRDAVRRLHREAEGD